MPKTAERGFEMDLKDMLMNGIGKEVKEKIEDAIEVCRKDPSVLKDLKDDPAKVLKKLGIDVDKDQIDKVVDMIKAGVKLDKADDELDKLEDAGDMLKGLFGKK